MYCFSYFEPVCCSMSSFNFCLLTLDNAKNLDKKWQEEKDNQWHMQLPKDKAQLTRLFWPGRMKGTLK